LLVITFVFILVISTIVAVFDLNPENRSLTFGEILWGSFLRTLDPGTMGSDSGIGFRVSMLIVTLFGVLVVASLIGIISNSLDSRIDQLRKGKSKVLESGHTLILGWNSKTIQIIRELVIANSAKRKSVIVILADRDKVEMEDEIRRKVGSFGNTRLVVRSGNTMSKTDLTIVEPGNARAIIILSPDSTNDADSISIKTCLALRGLKNPPKIDCSIVGEIHFDSNLEAAELVSQGSVHWVLGQDMIARLIVQTCKQGGLSSVFTDLLEFEGSELYLAPENTTAGLTYENVSMRLAEAVAVGVLRQNEVLLSPDPSILLLAGDQLIAIAADEAHLTIGEMPNIADVPSFQKSRVIDRLESTLIIGASSGMELLLHELDQDSLPGSKVVLVNPVIDLEEIQFMNINLEVVIADPTKRKQLELIGVQNFNHIIILPSKHGLAQKDADARTLLSLLHVRALLGDNSSTNIVSEILDDHNRELAESGRADDFIVSNKIVSHLISQLAQNIKLASVFNGLFSAERGKISLVPVGDYVQIGVPTSFDSIVHAALEKGQSAVGYRINKLKFEADSTHGVRLNPPRRESVQFSEDDTIILIGH